jgi:hypothetical protein
MKKCPICKSDADELEARTPQVHAIRCGTCGEFEFSNTVIHTPHWSAPREQWERALQNAINRAGARKRPKILSYDF